MNPARGKRSQHQDHLNGKVNRAMTGDGGQNIEDWVKWRMSQNDLHIDQVLANDTAGSRRSLSEENPVYFGSTGRRPMEHTGIYNVEGSMANNMSVYGIPRVMRHTDGDMTDISKTNSLANGNGLKHPGHSKPEIIQEKKKNPLWFCRWITERPKTFMGIGFIFHILMIATTAILFLLKYDIIPIVFDGLPLILQHDVDYLRYQAWANRNEDPSIMSRSSSLEKEAERSRPGEAFSIIYESKNKENVFTQDNLKKLQQIENSFTNNQDFRTTNCLLDKRTQNCSKPQSVLRYFDGTLKLLDAIFDDPDFRNITQVLYKASNHPKTKKLFNYFLANDAKIGMDEVFSRLTRSDVYLGLPLAGFANSTDRIDEQMDKIFDFTVKNFKNLAENAKDNTAGLNIIYFSRSILTNYIQTQVIFDMLLAVASLGFIFLFVLFQTQSLFVTFFSVFSIITSFLATNLIYRLVFDFIFFGIFHVLAIFIILGIGADNIFILFDTWKIEGLRNHPTTALSLSAAYSKAAKAMFFTSFTTAAAFLVSALSPLISIGSFGAFSGILIIMNYINVILYLPSVLMVYHSHFEKWTWPCCRPCIKNKGETDNDLDSLQNVHSYNYHESQPDLPAKPHNVNHEEHRWIVRFFRGPFFKLVTHKVAKWIILVIVLGFAGTCAYFASQLKVNEEEVKFLPDSTNLGRYLSVNNREFKQVNLNRNIKIFLIWGMKKQNRDACHRNLYKCKGSTEWDESFNINNDKVQKGFMEFCSTLKNLPKEEAQALGIKEDVVNGNLEISCFIDEYQQFLQDENASIPLTLNDSKTIMTSYPSVFNTSSIPDSYNRPFEIPLTFWLCGKYKQINGTRSCLRTPQYQTYNSLLGEAVDKYSVQVPNVKSLKYGTRLRYASILVNTSKVGNLLGYSEGLTLRNRWENFINKQKEKMPSEMQGVFQTTFIWNFLKVKKELSRSAYMGILIGLSIALPVLLIATMNIFVGLAAFFSLCCVIAAVIATMVLVGWELGVLESINLVLVVGLSVDYIVHLAEGYSRSKKRDNIGRVRDSLEEVGISVLSGALTTLGASFFMILAQILFFQQFAVFIFSTIGYSLFFALFLFIPLMAAIGPSEDCGSFTALVTRCCKSLKKY